MIPSGSVLEHKSSRRHYDKSDYCSRNVWTLKRVYNKTNILHAKGYYKKYSKHSRHLSCYSLTADTCVYIKTKNTPETRHLSNISNIRAFC